MSKSKVIKNAVEEAASIKALATEKTTREIMKKLSPKIERSVLEALHSKRDLDSVVSKMMNEAEVNFQLDQNSKMNVHIPDDQSVSDATAEMTMGPDEDLFDMEVEGDDEDLSFELDSEDFDLEDEEDEEFELDEEDEDLELEEESDEEEDEDLELDEEDFDLDSLFDEEEEEEEGLVADGIRNLRRNSSENAKMIAENYLRRAKFLNRIAKQSSTRDELFRVLESVETIGDSLLPEIKKTGYNFRKDKNIKKSIVETKNYINSTIKVVDSLSKQLLKENNGEKMKLSKKRLDELKLKLTPETEEEASALAGVTEFEVGEMEASDFGDEDLSMDLPDYDYDEDGMDLSGEFEEGPEFDPEAAGERIDQEIDSLSSDEDCDEDEEDCEDEDEETITEDDDSVETKEEVMKENRRQILARRAKQIRARKIAEARRASRASVRRRSTNEGLSSLSNQAIARELRRRRAIMEAKREHETAVASIQGTAGPEMFADDLDLNANDNDSVLTTDRSRMTRPRRPLEESLRQRIKVLEAKLQEAETDKQKLLFAARILRESSLTDEQKRTAIYALDSAKNLSEAKLAFRTASLMVESAKAKAPKKSREMALAEARKKAREAVAKKSRSLNESAATRSGLQVTDEEINLAEKMIQSFRK